MQGCHKEVLEALGALRHIALELGMVGAVEWCDLRKCKGKRAWYIKCRKVSGRGTYLVAKHLNFVYMTMRCCTTWNFEDLLSIPSFSTIVTLNSL